MLFKSHRPSVSLEQLTCEICWAIVRILVKPSFMFLTQICFNIGVVFLLEKKKEESDNDKKANQ